MGATTTKPVNLLYPKLLITTAGRLLVISCPKDGSKFMKIKSCC